LVEFCVPTFKPPPVPLVGVSGKELAEVGGDSRREALETGRKIPAPETVVVK
jgi:hypothetical protein